MSILTTLANPPSGPRGGEVRLGECSLSQQLRNKSGRPGPKPAADTVSSPEHPLASIIVNNHNHERFIKDSIDSALSQTYNDTEVIVEIEKQVGWGDVGADSYLAMLAPLFGTIRKVDEPQGRYRIPGASGFSSLNAQKKIARGLVLHEHRCKALATYCDELRIPLDSERWKSASWWHRCTRRLKSKAPPVFLDTD